MSCKYNTYQNSCKFAGRAGAILWVPEVTFQPSRSQEAPFSDLMSTGSTCTPFITVEGSDFWSCRVLEKILLSDLISDRHLNQLWTQGFLSLATGIQPSVPRQTSLHLRPMNVATAFLFACSTSSKAECWSHRHTQSKVLPSTAPTYSTHIKHEYRWSSLLLLLWLVEIKFINEHTTLDSEAHVQSQVPEASA